MAIVIVVVVVVVVVVVDDVFVVAAAGVVIVAALVVVGVIRICRTFRLWIVDCAILHASHNPCEAEEGRPH